MAYRLVGIDGNIFSVIGVTKRILEQIDGKISRQYVEEVNAMMIGGKNYEEILGFSAQCLQNHDEEFTAIEKTDALEEGQEVECENCNQSVPVDEAELLKGSWYCKTCIEESDECADCGKRLFHPNEGNSMGNGEWYCDHCWAEELDNSDREIED